MQQKHIPALQLAVVRQGKIVKLKSYGIANPENNIAATDQSIFSINSITKAFVGVAIMQLAEEGKLKVSDGGMATYNHTTGFNPYIGLAGYFR